MLHNIDVTCHVDLFMVGHKKKHLLSANQYPNDITHRTGQTTDVSTKTLFFKSELNVQAEIAQCCLNVCMETSLKHREIKGNRFSVSVRGKENVVCMLEGNDQTV